MKRNERLKRLRHSIQTELRSHSIPRNDIREKLVAKGGANSLTIDELAETLRAMRAGVYWSYATIAAKLQDGATVEQLIEELRSYGELR